MTQKLTLKSTVGVPGLAEAVTIAKRSLAERTTLPITNCFLVNFNGNAEVISTDLEVMTKVIVRQCGTEIDGSFIVPGRIFTDIVDELNSKLKDYEKRKKTTKSKRIPVMRCQFIRYDNQDTFVTCENFGFRFTTNYEADDFVPCPEVQGEEISILDMPAMLKNLAKHCPNENREYRQSLCGVEFDLENNKAIATDGMTMGIAKLSFKKNGELNGKFRIPRKAAEILSRLDGTCQVTFNEERVKLVIGNVEVVTRNLDKDSTYPDWSKLDGDENKAKIKHYS